MTIYTVRLVWRVGAFHQSNCKTRIIPSIFFLSF